MSFEPETSRLPKRRLYPTDLYKCNYCGQCFTQPRNLTKHQENVHNITSGYACRIRRCKKHLPTLDDLRKHMAEHTQIRKCQTCEETFTEYSQFLTHTNIHPVIKPYKCNTCKRTFKTKVLRDNHEDSKHKNVYKCNICSRTLRSQSGLTQHIKHHQGNYKQRKVPQDSTGDPLSLCNSVDTKTIKQEPVYDSDNEIQVKQEVTGTYVYIKEDWTE